MSGDRFVAAEGSGAAGDVFEDVSAPFADDDALPEGRAEPADGGSAVSEDASALSAPAALPLAG